MAGAPGRSGGHNRKTLDQHVAAGTFRADRHLKLVEPRDSPPVSAADREQVVAGLPEAAQRIAAALMDTHGDWDAAGLHTLRQFAASCGRLAQLDADGADAELVQREVRCNLSLMKALNLEAAR